MRRRLFLSYRRGDTAAAAGRVYDRILRRLPKSDVFFDVGAIKGGEEFPLRIASAIESSDAALVFIGDKWLDAADAPGRARLEDPEDFVRLEIRLALNRKMLTIPVLVGGATMPRAEQLPPDIAALATRNALPLRHESFDADTEEIIGAALGQTPSTYRPSARSVWTRRALFSLAGCLGAEAALLAAAIIHKLIMNAPLAAAIGNAATFGLIVGVGLFGAGTGGLIAARPLR